MAAEHTVTVDVNEKYTLTATMQRKIWLWLAVGLILFIAGAFWFVTGFGSEAAHGAGHAAAHGGGGGEHFNPMARVWANLWLNSVFFVGIAVAGVFFLATQYAAKAGWSAIIKRVPEAFGGFLPVGGVIMLVVYFLGHHDLFHWTHTGLYEKGGPEFDAIINGKAPFFYWPLSPEGGFPFFWLLRLVLYFALWFLVYTVIRKASLAEDQLQNRLDFRYYDKQVVWSIVFIVIFAITSSTSAWDWLLSIDTHWFSTMFGWYVFASWFVSALATITLAVVYLKEQGYLKAVNENHLHDLGKFMFAFSIFWTYVWFCQFLLIYYANIPEETFYFKERLHGLGGVYSPVMIVLALINFAFPFLFLMPRDSKRHPIFLKITAFAILVGHYLDFYLMVMPGTAKQYGGFGLMEIGAIIVFASLFVWLFYRTLSKAPLIAKNHPMLEESLHHSI